MVLRNTFLLSIVWLSAFLPAIGQEIKPIDYHVALHGNDRNPGSLERPFARLEAARDAIRNLKRRQGGSLKQPVEVHVHRGTYNLVAPFVLGPEDSGSKLTPITYQAAPGETVRLSGGRTITNWQATTIEQKSLWVAEIPGVKAGQWYPHQLFIDGQRRTRARHPNTGFFKVAGLPTATKETPRSEGQDRFQFTPGDLSRYRTLEDVDVVAMHLWVAVRLSVVTIDEKERVANFLQKSRRKLVEGNDPARFYVENAFELLDSPGEWYLDKVSGNLFYWPLPGEDPSKVACTLPLLPELLVLQGEPEKKHFIDHIHFRGLLFEHSDWWPNRDDTSDIQAAAPVPACVRGEGIRECRFERCTIAHASGYGLHLGKGSQRNVVVGCQLYDLGAGGIKVGEMAIREDDALQSHSNLVSDNHLHDLGQIFHQGVGVWVGQSFSNRIAHNHIHDLYYSGISTGWTWGYKKSQAQGNIIEFNHVHDLGKAWLSDMGGFYSLGIQPGTIVRNNVFADIAGYRYGGWGIYFDEGSSDILAENNLVYRTTHGGFHQHYGKDNMIRNNIFALGREAQIRRSKIEPHRSFTFERNLVYWREGKLLDGNWDELNVNFDRNLYWKLDGSEPNLGKRTWKSWRELGLDANSLHADPRFVAAEKGDFRLAGGSPAASIGFIPLELRQVGPRPEYQQE